jgi:phenylalanyl-tRNA synthetase beta chain
MKFTLSWLKDHLDTSASLDDIVAALIGVGLEVEAVEDRSKALAPFKVAHVRKAEKHPNADKLRVCIVETADGTFQVVCGAPNARAGMKGIVALPGAYIPGTKITLEKGTIRGQESQGMLLSERELMISDEHSGIIDVVGDWPVGTPAAKALGLDDPMLYVKVTANRPDALGVHGIARDLAAKGLGTLKPIDVAPVAGTFDSPIKVSLDFPDGDTKPCPLFVGRYFRGVKNGSSPEWLKRRLKAIGLRPISALVDITNYITFSYGRPLHVFDADKVKGNIRARMAKGGEELAALDNKTYALDPSITVIADDAGPEGIAGIIGGEATSCTEATTNVFLEAAYFDPLRTAASGRKLGVNSDARYRFERGVDPAFVGAGAEIATRMVLELCGGEASHLVVAGKAPLAPRRHTLRKDRVKRLAGADIPWADQLAILKKLGFAVTEAAGGASAEPPSWRPDVQGEADLVEDICRIHGLDRIPLAPLPRPHAVARAVLNPLQRRMIAARRRMAERGLNEAVTWSFLAEREAMLFGGQRNPSLMLANPISSELTDMRPTLIANLVSAVGRNLARGFDNVALFEVGQAYAGDRPQDETLRVGGVRQGENAPRHWSERPRPVDAFDAKADALAVLDAAGAPMANLQIVAGGPHWLHPGRLGTIQLGPQNKLAVFGEVHPRVLAAMDVKGPLVAFEVTLDTIPGARTKSATRAALTASNLMPLSRDFAFVVENGVEAEKLVKAARAADKQLVSDVSVFDVFQMPDGKKSIAIAVTLQPREQTLTDTDIEAVSARIVAQVGKATGGVLRS